MSSPGFNLYKHKRQSDIHPAKQAKDRLHNNQKHQKWQSVENNKKTTNKAIYIASTIGLTIALLWQVGGPLLTEGPLGGVIKKARDAAPVNTTWEYKEAKDTATGVITKDATLNSTNTADTGFGPTARMRLILTENKHIKIVTLRLN